MKSGLISCIAVIALAGCATARPGASNDFIRQWRTIHPGLTTQEVHTRLGKPYVSYIPPDSFNLVEYWLFTDTDWAVVPPPESYVINYDNSGRVSTSATPRTQSK
ncbi:MAG TPA: hypothetical protein VF614_13415 [Chthoniobacteraceae bacterium]